MFLPVDSPFLLIKWGMFSLTATKMFTQDFVANTNSHPDMGGSLVSEMLNYKEEFFLFLLHIPLCSFILILSKYKNFIGEKIEN